jgi:hypothetical protein
MAPDDRNVDLNDERCSATAWLDELGAAERERLEEIRDAACVLGHGDPELGRNGTLQSVLQSAVHQAGQGLNMLPERAPGWWRR